VIPPMTIRVLSVEEAATVLGAAPRTVRRWLQNGDLAGKKIGTTWIVLLPEERATRQTHRHGMRLTRKTPPALPRIRTRLRQLGHQLIAIGNTTAGAQQKRGEVFLTWRRPGSLQIMFAMGRITPTRAWAPYTVGTELPFWLTERRQWRPVQRLLKQYEQLRHWCHPRLLRLPQVVEIVEAELHRLQAAVDACAAQAAAQGVDRSERGDRARPE
jgi:excisionase family DNA binding protein